MWDLTTALELAHKATGELCYGMVLIHIVLLLYSGYESALVTDNQVVMHLFCVPVKPSEQGFLHV